MTSERRKQGTLQKGKKDMHIKDWPEGDRPREMLWGLAGHSQLLNL